MSMFTEWISARISPVLFFTLRLVRHWHRLPRGAVAAPSLELFNAKA